MDIDVLKELNLELLTERQRAVVSMTLDGKTQVEIGKELGCRQATVSRLIQYAIRRNSRILTSKEKPLSPKKTETQKKDENTQKKKINSHSSSTNRYNRYDYGVYKDRDLSILSQHEKEIMTLKIDGLTYQQIADRLDITSGCVGALIQKSRAKLDGTYRYNRYNRYDYGVYKDRDLSILSQREKEIMTLKIDGLTYQQIADRLDITSGCVGALIQKSLAKLDGTYTQKKDENTQKKKINSHSSSTNRYNKYDYGVYKDRDLSILSQREKEIMTLKIDGLTYQQIADRLDITSGCVGALIQKSRAKLDGTYHDGLRLTINRRRYESVLRDPVREKENRKRTYRKNRKKRIADMKEYNKKYYQQHREKLLKRQKERQEKNREEA
ncbi:sigma factor-like helix-turn-helix DNA-binding protein [[Clostridium] symbiosum]|uniref:sigma factor-like helix-turn-helix DNA-binding protein n=1 Tax=Clostridium symbiosum TaxID=1512 RepID=UPI00232B58ED|nr:sigma factor-like helix-turn-helix DNA-binding protein [[Clostridium] symbiosum]MDB2022185.1 sigma factor-like helix-turn-helix DNA-binding protein [[Clostridium] symbiosum]